MERLIVWHRWCPPLDVTPETVAQATLWRIAARDRFAQLGADALSELSGTVVFSLPPGDLPRALGLCLALASTAEGEAPQAGGVSFALTLGQLERTSVAGAWIGDALDRAQVLSSVAASGDIVVDVDAQSRLANTHLFAREVQTATGTSAVVVDREHPYREQCRESLIYLARPALPASSAVQLDVLRRLAASPGRKRVLLVAARGSGATAWLQQLSHELTPPAWIDVRSLGAGFAPLSGLMYALRRLPGNAQLESVLDARDDPDQHALKTLCAIRDGRAASRRDAIMALRQYVGRCWERTGHKAFITVNPVSLADPASVGVVAEVARDGGPECFLVMRLFPDTKPPEVLTRAGGLSEVRVPSLSAQDAQKLAASMLHSPTATGAASSTIAEIARRAAVMGGSSPLGVAEAVRVLVSAGDVVHRDGAFTWRRGPSGRTTHIGMDALLDERITPLPVTTRRVLEILATVPDPTDATLVGDVALAEGVTGAMRANAIDELVRLALIDVTPVDIRVSPTVRHVVETGASDARRAELSLRIATALAQHEGAVGGFARANVAFYLARGGRPKDGVPTLLEVAADAGAAGFVRSGVRMAAAAVECDPSEETHAAAASIAQALTENLGPGRMSRVPTPPLRTSQAEAPPEAPVATLSPRGPHADTRASADALIQEAENLAIAAVKTGHAEHFERALELLVAAGGDGAHIDRLHAMFELSRGQVSQAQQLIAHARLRKDADPTSPRTKLAAALVGMEAGEGTGSVRNALEALSTARAGDDRQGTVAALKALSLLYVALARPDDALKLRQASESAGAAGVVLASLPHSRGKASPEP